MEAAEVLEAVASTSETSQEATCHLFTMAVRRPGCMELTEAARAAAQCCTRKELGPLDKLNYQHLAHEEVTVVQAAHGHIVDRVTSAALVAAAVWGAVVDSVEGAQAGSAAHLVAAAEEGSVVDLVEAAEVAEAVASAADASQDATCHIFTLAVRPPRCMDLVEAAMAAAQYWARKALGALAKLDDQHLAYEVVTAVQAANGAMALLGAVCLAVAALDQTVASADSVYKANSEVAAPAADWEACLLVPGGLAENVRDRAAVPRMVVGMEALGLPHLLAAGTVSHT